jgi:two-component system, chemotaxis family, response regulator Rcp1
MNSELRDSHAAEILLAEGNPGDVELTRKAPDVARVANRLHVAADRADAIDFLLHRGRFTNTPQPDIILLDLNLPNRDGRQVLSEIMADANLSQIPIAILTASRDDEDIQQAYQLHANCYMAKPIDFDQFLRIVAAIEEFSLTEVNLPRKMQ